MKRTIGLYVRTATSGDGLAEAQRKKLLSFAEFLLAADPNWGEIVDEYIDDGVSALNRDRAGLNRLFEDVRQGRVNTLFVQDETRLSRTFTHFISMVEELRSHQVKIHFLNHLTPTPSLEKTINVKNFLGGGFDWSTVQENKDEARTDAGTTVGDTGS
jgi:DNA invertase Pin-like site-specific DNA recombinase